jgi:GLPGLI family protein
MKTVKFLFVIIAVAFISFVANAQKPFTGTITYSMTYEGEELDAATRSQLPSEMITHISEKKVRNEQVSPFYNVASISNLDDGSSITLFDAMGMKYAVTQTKEENDKLKEEAGITEPVIKLVDETKTIAGYKCKKAEVTMPNSDNVYEVYYTTEINAPKEINENLGFKQIDGVLMQYPIDQGAILITVTAKEIKKGKPKAQLFSIPDDFQKLTMEEFNSMF